MTDEKTEVMLVGDASDNTFAFRIRRRLVVDVLATPRLTRSAFVDVEDVESHRKEQEEASAARKETARRLLWVDEDRRAPPPPIAREYPKNRHERRAAASKARKGGW